MACLSNNKQEDNNQLFIIGQVVHKNSEHCSQPSTKTQSGITGISRCETPDSDGVLSVDLLPELGGEFYPSDISNLKAPLARLFQSFLLASFCIFINKL